MIVSRALRSYLKSPEERSISGIVSPPSRLTYRAMIGCGPSWPRPIQAFVTILRVSRAHAPDSDSRRGWGWMTRPSTGGGAGFTYGVGDGKAVASAQSGARGFPG